MFIYIAMLAYDTVLLLTMRKFQLYKEVEMYTETSSIGTAPSFSIPNERKETEVSQPLMDSIKRKVPKYSNNEKRSLASDEVKEDILPELDFYEFLDSLTEEDNILNKPVEPNEIKVWYEEREVMKTDLDFALESLEKLIGLNTVKTRIHEIVDFVQIQKERNRFGQRIEQQSLHMIFTGNPGTGKTTVARIVAKVLSHLDVVSKGHLVEVTREDLVAAHVGGTAEKTKAKVKEALGGVLFIDEAYALSRGSEQDFGKEAIDTLVREMEEHRGDLIVILAGYSNEMEEFLDANSGLKSRFPMTVEFEDYTMDEMMDIAKSTLVQKDFKLGSGAEEALKEVLESKQLVGRNDAGNGRLVRNVIEQAIRTQSKRLKSEEHKERHTYYLLKPCDFGLSEDKQAFDLEKKLESFVGNDKIKQHVRSLASNVKFQKMREEQGLPVKHQSLHMVFEGNPGTGKTSFARIIAELFKEMGVLKKGQLVEVDRSDLVAGYVGQTAVKTKKVIEKALGGILFIDEAYALASGGPNDFGQEAINTIVKAMDDYRENLIVIVAGYTKEMGEFFQANSGLHSRFPETFVFEDYSTDEMLEITSLMAENQGYKLTAAAKIELLNFYSSAQGKNDAGNGRLVRNVLEKAERNLAQRLATEVEVTREDLTTITDKDIIGNLSNAS
ncbi:AAA family ATPase (plasmid) [Alkalihalophilus sp. As8PL]|uniref:AAA family ATPase n=1 Tax=Alkalihalophilus sp. As8PL TaxID=3237103 RepID=A0AB39BNM9_9BACI